MTEFTLQAQKKSEKGTGASRRLRRAGKIPAIIYGNNSDAVSVTLDHDKVLHASQEKAFYDATITIDIEGTTESVKIKALQRHPFKPKLIHVDFVRV
ncbi:50S ribosomal protein L25 [Facilibium subflavum]|uniref:50S ribosomal protein L25 n=1 Tax=Facilibium subflavum TaxID=2219058 RepID=UPI000E649957|nr:50S ribosomal protein L25 [Facilibium subflavum]